MSMALSKSTACSYDIDGEISNPRYYKLLGGMLLETSSRATPGALIQN